MCRNCSTARRGGLPVITHRTMGIPVRTTSVAQGTVIRPLQRARRWRAPTASATMKVKQIDPFYCFSVFKKIVIREQ